MTKALVSGGMFVLLCGIAGCGGPITSPSPLPGGNTGDGLWQEKIRIWYELADAVETDAPQASFDRLTGRLVAIARAEVELNLPVAEQERLEEKYFPELRKASRRLTEAMAHNPAGADKLTRAKFDGSSGASPRPRASTRRAP
jgi:hypothetical protein